MSNPKPIGPDPARDGAYQVVVSFRVRPLKGLASDDYGWSERDRWHYAMRGALEQLFKLEAEIEGLDVQVDRIGAQGEASQLKGTGP